jgi:hypothetical protein
VRRGAWVSLVYSGQRISSTERTTTVRVLSTQAQTPSHTRHAPPRAATSAFGPILVLAQAMRELRPLASDTAPNDPFPRTHVQMHTRAHTGSYDVTGGWLDPRRSLHDPRDDQNILVAHLQDKKAHAKEAQSKGRRPWDSSPWVTVPPSMRGMKIYTQEPWLNDHLRIRDADVGIERGVITAYPRA